MITENLGNMNQKTKMVDVPKMITDTIVKALNKCHAQERLVDWNNLKIYVMEFFMVADYRADSCIAEARKISIYE